MGNTDDKPKDDFKDDFELISGEHNALRALIQIRNKEHADSLRSLKMSPFGVLKNAIVESLDKDGEPMLFAARIEIDGMKDFDCKPAPKGQIDRIRPELRAKNPRHPYNIERITFIINGEDVEFVKCG